MKKIAKIEHGATSQFRRVSGVAQKLYERTFKVINWRMVSPAETRLPLQIGLDFVLHLKVARELYADLAEKMEGRLLELTSDPKQVFEVHGYRGASHHEAAICFACDVLVGVTSLNAGSRLKVRSLPEIERTIRRFLNSPDQLLRTWTRFFLKNEPVFSNEHAYDEGVIARLRNEARLCDKKQQDDTDIIMPEDFDAEESSASRRKPGELPAPPECVLFFEQGNRDLRLCILIDGETRYLYSKGKVMLDRLSPFIASRQVHIKLLSGILPKSQLVWPTKAMSYLNRKLNDAAKLALKSKSGFKWFGNFNGTIMLHPNVQILDARPKSIHPTTN